MQAIGLTVSLSLMPRTQRSSEVVGSIAALNAGCRRRHAGRDRRTAGGTCAARVVTKLAAPSGQGAGAAPDHQFAPALDARVGTMPVAVSAEILERAGDRLQAMDAGPALPRALALQPAGHSCHLGDDARRFGQQEDDAAAEAQAALLEQVGVEPQVDGFGAQPGAGVAAQRAHLPAGAAKPPEALINWPTVVPPAISTTPG